MKATVFLQTLKGEPVDEVSVGIPNATCNSDIVQQLPQLVLRSTDRMAMTDHYYTFHRFNEGTFSATFREKTVICV